MLKLTEIPKDSGVYCVQNLINNKIYIGSSKNLYRRFYSHKNGDKDNSCRNIRILNKAYKKYKPENFSFQVLKITKNYLFWEELFIRLLNPEYNIATITNGKNQPNIGKKFNKEWILKLGKCKKHSEETLEKISKCNKDGGIKVIFEKNNEVLNFNSWVSAGKFFKIKGKLPSTYFTKTKLNENIFKWKKWKITSISKQTKSVLLKTSENFYKFKSASECDKFLNLWRGATSNAIRNNSGFLHNCKVEYL